MKLRYLICTFLLSVAGQLACAQQGYTSLSYNTAAPLGDTKDFIQTYSWRGISLESHWFLSDNVTLGGYLGWNVFYEKTSGDFSEGTQTLSGTQQRYLNAIPLIAEGRYHFGDEGTIRPYLGFGLGTYRTLQRTEMGIFRSENNNWQFGLTPAVGILIPVGPTALQLGIRYNIAFETDDAIGHSYLGINLGVAWVK